jgi:degradative hydroxymethylglutaryl-CoA reductase
VQKRTPVNTDSPESQTIINNIVKNFHRQPIEQRLHQLQKLYPDLDLNAMKNGGLSIELADHMIENCIGVISLPLGLGLSCKVNHRTYLVPMAIEEPSVIAACSVISKLIATEGSGFTCKSTQHVMIGQIQLTDIQDCSRAVEKILARKQEVIELGNTFCRNMANRGGGVRDVRCRALAPDMLVVELLVDVQDAMGANIVNTVCEGVSSFVQECAAQGVVGVRILTNLCTERMTESSFKIPLEKLVWKGVSGREVAAKILETQRFAELDQYRATTHNKGIMNGIDAVAIALGQDFRAVEAAAHSYAAITGKYKPLTSYWTDGSHFYGKITMPISVGTKGGAIATSPAYTNTHMMMGFPSTEQLA